MAERKWSDAIPLLQRVLRTSPRRLKSGTSWRDVALLLNRYDVALDAYRHLIELEPAEPLGYLGAAEVLLKERRLGAARARALEAAALATDNDPGTLASRGAAHALVARIALAQRDADGAREQATLAQQADPGLADAGVRRGTDSLRPGQVRGGAAGVRGGRGSGEEARRDADPGAALLCRRDADAARTAAGGRSGIPERSCGAFRRTSAPGQRSRRCITRRDSRTPRTAAITDMLRAAPTPEYLHDRRAPVDLVRPARARRRRSAPKRGARFPKAARRASTNN